VLTADIVGLLTDVGQREAFRPWGAWAWWGGIRLAGGELRVHESFSPYFSRLFVSAFHYHLLSIITYFPLPTPPFWLVTEINLQVSLIVVSYLRKLCGKVADLPILNTK
jgi:hypothetical protein